MLPEIRKDSTARVADCPAMSPGKSVELCNLLQLEKHFLRSLFNTFYSMCGKRTNPMAPVHDDMKMKPVLLEIEQNLTKCCSSV